MARVLCIWVFFSLSAQAQPALEAELEAYSVIVSPAATARKIPRDIPDRRFPELYNPNPLHRLYTQPLGPYPHKVIRGMRAELVYIASAEYNNYFHDGRGGTRVGQSSGRTSIDPGLLHHHTNTFILRLSRGVLLGEQQQLPLELGAELRIFHDDDSGPMAAFLAGFHKATGDHSHIPQTGQPYNGSVGENHTVVVGKKGRIYVGAADLYAKLQVLEEQPGSVLPDVAVKFNVRMPVRDASFERFGAGFSLGARRSLGAHFAILLAASAAFQNINEEDFNSGSIRVRPWAIDAFAGLQWDPGEPGGFYTTWGVRYSNRRISYRENPLSATDTYVIHGAMAYQISRAWEVFISMAEEIPNTEFRGLEPDLSFAVGILARF